MAIKVTDELIAAARDASIALTGHCSTFLETRVSLEAAFAILERDYVSRWGVLRQTLGFGGHGTLAEENAKFMDAVKAQAVRQAEFMGATIEPDEFVIKDSTDPYNPVRYIEWKLRRND